MFAMGPAFFGSQAASLSYAATVLADSPLAYWQLNETSGTNAADSSPNARNATYVGSPTLNATGLVRGGGGSVQLDGSTSKYMNLATTYSALTGLNRNFSIEWWMSLTDMATTYAIFSNGLPSPGNGGIYLRTTSTGALEVLQSNTTVVFTISSSFSANTTYYCVFSYDSGNGWYLHINGALAFSGTNAATFGTTGHTSLGVDNNLPYSVTFNGNMKGRLGHMAVYGAKLSDARIAAHYAAGH